MYECRVYALDELEGFQEQLPGLTRKPGHDIYPEENPGLSRAFHLLAYIIQPFFEENSVVPPSHPSKNRVAAALKRNVEMWLELGSGGYPVYYLRGYQVRLYGGDPVPFNAFYAVQGLDP